MTKMTLSKQWAKKPISIYAIRQTWRHHAGPSGYDPLFQTLLNDSRVRVSFSFPGRKNPKKWRNGFLQTLSRNGRMLLQLIHIYLSSPVIVHLSVVEQQLSLITSIRRYFPHILMIGTVHQLPEYWPKDPDTILPLLNQLDALIALSRSQANYWRKRLGDDRVFFIPHGVDSNFFSPQASNETKTQNEHLLFVGHWLRDFKVLEEVISNLSTRTNVFFDVVIPDAYLPDVVRELAQQYQDRVRIHFNLSDNELAQMYRDSTLMILPLTASSANNALLEAMASGLPIVSTDVGGVRDYLADEFARIGPQGDSHVMTQSIQRLLSDPIERQRMSCATRMAAQELSWDRIAQKTLDVYSAVLNRRNSVQNFQK
jgi:glycosyltransferase involved in cell wall biosynthesis